MDNTDLKNSLLEIAQKLIAIAGGSNSTEEVPNTIAVRPTGLYGQGKVRYWPVPIEVNRMDGTRGMELCWSYALRMTYEKNADGEPLVPRIYRDQIGAWMQMVSPDPTQWRRYPEAVDRWVYPEDWMTADEIQKKQISDAQWGQQEANMGR